MVGLKAGRFRLQGSGFEDLWAFQPRMWIWGCGVGGGGVRFQGLGFRVYRV